MRALRRLALFDAHFAQKLCDFLDFLELDERPHETVLVCGVRASCLKLAVLRCAARWALE